MKKSIIGFLVGVGSYFLLNAINHELRGNWIYVINLLALFIFFIISYYNKDIRQNLRKKNMLFHSIICLIISDGFIFIAGNTKTFLFSILFSIMVLLFLLFCSYMDKKNAHV